MKRATLGFRVSVGAVIASAAVACSAGDGTRQTLLPGAGGAGGAGVGGGVSGGGVGGGVSLPGAGGLLDPGVGGGSAGVDGGSGTACQVGSRPEEVIQYSPVGLFIMQDRSGSMVTGLPPPANPLSWQNSTTAISAFVSDPSSAGISVGLGAFPPLTSVGDCVGGTDCGAPIVPIAELPGNAQAMIDAMQTATPLNPAALTPTECGLRGMAATCAAYTQQTQVPCVGVLVTDGTPTQCDQVQQNLVAIVANAAAQGTKTFVIGLPGANLVALNELAVAGGTNAAIDVSAGATAFIDALNSIRSQVSVGTKLDCQWTIPEPPEGQVFNASKVNVKFTPESGPQRDFGYVKEADCPSATDAWYFDDPDDPRIIAVCPSTCDMLKQTSNAAIDVEFGCDTRPAQIQ